MTDLFAHVGMRIRELRMGYDSGRGLSQEKLAEALGIATNTVSRWETATYHPGLGDLDRLAAFFGVSILEFLPSSNQPTDQGLNALLQTARQLEPGDVEEVRRYAEFRKANRMYGSASRPRAGRKPKPRGE